MARDPRRLGCPRAEAHADRALGLAHEKLPDADAAARMKAMWRERLTALKALLEPF